MLHHKVKKALFSKININSGIHLADEPECIDRIPITPRTKNIKSHLSDLNTIGRPKTKDKD